jgi:hypothetical protein
LNSVKNFDLRIANIRNATVWNRSQSYCLVYYLI